MVLARTSLNILNFCECTEERGQTGHRIYKHTFILHLPVLYKAQSHCLSRCYYYILQFPQTDTHIHVTTIALPQEHVGSLEKPVIQSCLLGRTIT